MQTGNTKLDVNGEATEPQTQACSNSMVWPWRGQTIHVYVYVLTVPLG